MLFGAKAKPQEESQLCDNSSTVLSLLAPSPRLPHAFSEQCKKTIADFAGIPYKGHSTQSFMVPYLTACQAANNIGMTPLPINTNAPITDYLPDSTTENNHSTENNERTPNDSEHCIIC